jgi:hypothetical protein
MLPGVKKPRPTEVVVAHLSEQEIAAQKTGPCFQIVNGSQGRLHLRSRANKRKICDVRHSFLHLFGASFLQAGHKTPMPDDSL